MRAKRAILAIAVLAAVAGCSLPGPQGAPDGIHDPFEAQNRRVHDFNRALDKRLFSGGGDSLPQGPAQVVTNLADTLSLPRTVVNQVLQGRPGDATRNTLRFAINATLGFGGLADVASDLGLPRDESDFGETLAVWGLPEGAYQELPVLGPSTERDTAGRVVDLFLNPLDYHLSRPDRRIKSGVTIAGKAADRLRYGDAVDSVLHDSADSYAQARLIYLQNRRFELGQTGDAAAGASYIDPDAIDTEGF